MDSTHDAQPAIEALQRRFRAQRPLRSGSLLMTIFGDAIAPRGGRITLGSLIRLAEPFGLAERLVRTAVARLAAADWLLSVRAGRHSEYRLTETGRAVFAEATARIYAPNPSAWHGRWTLLALAAGRADRSGLRAALRGSASGRSPPGSMCIRRSPASKRAHGSRCAAGPRRAGCSRAGARAARPTVAA
ncbi:phenylacetic acid degradation transcriptional repressor [mine drainage metagenome]|uniref:Phenylacetic acid degradation transcriptional repressor n=1 Tax=mine drainage metagenome TaxID=410659 RepID=T1CIY6_9ZZZZ